jgi:putative membrane protein
MHPDTFLPYCGAPPVPGELSWNSDPVLITALGGIGLLYLAACRHPQGPGRGERLLFGAGLLLTGAALISPLCNLSVALFAARVSQHMVLTLVAAPLIVLGRLDKAVAILLGRRRLEPSRLESRRGMPVIGGIGFTIALWVWHLPGPYDGTLQNNLVYWVMHFTTFGTALMLWQGLLRHDPARIGTAVVVGFVTAMQMSLLGAVLTLAPRALFAVHTATTWPWGLSSLQDQQLGGLIMWVPAGLLFTTYAMVGFGVWLSRLEASPRANHLAAVHRLEPDQR